MSLKLAAFRSDLFYHFEIVLIPRRICRFIWRLHSFPVYATMLLQIYKEGLCKLHEQKWLGQGYLPI